MSFILCLTDHIFFFHMNGEHGIKLCQFDAKNIEAEWPICVTNLGIHWFR